MKKKNILLLSLLSLGFVNSTPLEQLQELVTRPHIEFVQRINDSIQRSELSNIPVVLISHFLLCLSAYLFTSLFYDFIAPEQSRQLVTRQHIQFVQRVDNSIQRAEANKLAEGNVPLVSLINYSVLYYDGNQLRTDRDLLLRALTEGGYTRPYVLFDYLPSRHVWDAKMSVVSKDRKHIPGLTEDLENTISLFLYLNSKIEIYRCSIRQTKLHVDGADKVSSGITAKELAELTQDVFEATFPFHAFVRACDQINRDIGLDKVDNRNNIFLRIHNRTLRGLFRFWKYPLNQLICNWENNWENDPQTLIRNPHINNSHYRALARNAVIHLFDSVKQNLVPDYLKSTAEARIWDENDNLRSSLYINCKSSLYDFIALG